MIIPVFILFGVIASLFIFEKENAPLNPFALLCVFASMVLICTFRDINMPDSINYIDDFSGFMVNERFEIGYTIIRDAVKAIGANYRVLFFAVALVSIFIKLNAIVRISPYVYGSLLVYLSYFFILHDMIQMRAGLAVGFLFFAIKYISERNLTRFIIAATLASCCHLSSLVIFPLWFLPLIRFNKLVWVFLIPLCYFLVVVYGLTAGRIISYIPINQIQNLYIGYSHSLEQGNHDVINIFNMLLLGKVVVCTFLILYNDLIESRFSAFKPWLMIYTASLAIYIMFSDLPVVAIRISEFLQTVELIIIPMFVFVFSDRFVGKIIVISISAVYLLGITFINEYLL